MLCLGTELCGLGGATHQGRLVKILPFWPGWQLGSCKLKRCTLNETQKLAVRNILSKQITLWDTATFEPDSSHLEKKEIELKAVLNGKEHREIINHEAGLPMVLFLLVLIV